MALQWRIMRAYACSDEILRDMLPCGAHYKYGMCRFRYKELRRELGVTTAMRSLRRLQELQDMQLAIQKPAPAMPRMTLAVPAGCPRSGGFAAKYMDASLLAVVSTSTEVELLRFKRSTGASERRSTSYMAKLTGTLIWWCRLLLRVGFLHAVAHVPCHVLLG